MVCIIGDIDRPISLYSYESYQHSPTHLAAAAVGPCAVCTHPNRLRYYWNHCGPHSPTPKHASPQREVRKKNSPVVGMTKSSRRQESFFSSCPPLAAPPRAECPSSSCPPSTSCGDAYIFQMNVSQRLNYARVWFRGLGNLYDILFPRDCLGNAIV